MFHTYHHRRARMDFNLGFLCSWESYWLIKLKAFVQESNICLVLCTKTDAICTRIVLVITHAVIPIRWDSLTASRQPFRWFTWNTNLLIWSWSCNAMTYSLDIPQSWIRTENIYRLHRPLISFNAIIICLPSSADCNFLYIRLGLPLFYVYVKYIHLLQACYVSLSSFLICINLHNIYNPGFTAQYVQWSLYFKTTHGVLKT